MGYGLYAYRHCSLCSLSAVPTKVCSKVLPNTLSSSSESCPRGRQHDVTRKTDALLLTPIQLGEVPVTVRKLRSNEGSNVTTS
jgi:hypothetical protein